MKKIGIISFPYKKDEEYKMNLYKNWLNMYDIIIIPYNTSIYSMHSILDSLDGILWTGGNIENHNVHSQQTFMTYMYLIEFTYYYAIERNKTKHFTIVGICQGFEILGLLCVNSKITYDYFKTLHKTTKKGLSSLTINTTLFTKKELDYMKTNNVVIHNHYYGFDVNKPVTHELKKCAKILSIDSYGQGKFINMFKYKQYPFYGMMFHPEKINNFVSKKLALLFTKDY